MLLLIDHLALRARNYEYLIRLFQEWEVRVATSRTLKGQPGLPSLSGAHHTCSGNSLRTRRWEPESALVDLRASCPSGFFVTFAEQDAVFLEGVQNSGASGDERSRSPGTLCGHRKLLPHEIGTSVHRLPFCGNPEQPGR